MLTIGRSSANGPISVVLLTHRIVFDKYGLSVHGSNTVGYVCDVAPPCCSTLAPCLQSFVAYEWARDPNNMKHCEAWYMLHSAALFGSSKCSQICTRYRIMLDVAFALLRFYKPAFWRSLKKCVHLTCQIQFSIKTSCLWHKSLVYGLL